MKSPRRLRLQAVAILLVVAALLLSAAVSQRHRLVRAYVADQLAEIGLPDTSFSVTRFDAEGLELHDLRVGSGENLSIERVEAGYSPSSLLAGRFETLRISGIRLHGAIGSSGLEFGALGLPAEEEGAAAPGPLVLPADEIEISDFRGEIAGTGDGRIEASGALALAGSATDVAGSVSLRLAVRGGLQPGVRVEMPPVELAAIVSGTNGEIEIDLAPATFSVDLDLDGTPQKIEGETPRLRLSTSGAIASEGGRLALPETGMSARGLRVDARLDSATGLPMGSLRLEAVEDLRAPARLPPLSLEIDTEARGERVVLEARLADVAQRILLTATGQLDPARGEAECTFHLQPVEFAPEGLQPIHLFPALGDALHSAQGTVEVRGALTWTDGETSGEVDVGLSDFSVVTPLARFDRVNMALHVDGPWPPSTPAGQLLFMASVDFGLQLTDGHVTYDIRPDGTLHLEKAEWRFAGGTLHTSGSIDPLAEDQSVVLQVRGVDLAELFGLVNLEGLTGTGRLDGKLPLSRHGERIEIRGGVLTAAEGGGWVRYQPDADMAGLGATTPDVNVVLGAMENFRYESLELTLDGHAQGIVQLGLHLRGANPDYESGHEVEFNLSLESRLVDLLRNEVAVYQMPALIEKGLRRISEGPSE